MNAVVAIGGSRLLQAVKAYRARIPSAVWVMNAVIAIGGSRLLQAVNAYRARVPSAVWV